MDLKPAYSVKSLILRSTVNRTSLRFNDGGGTLKVTLTPFFQGPKGEQGEKGDSASISYTHYQNTPASIWTIQHNLGFWPNVYVLDTSGDECEGAVQNTTVNRVDIFFSAPFAGRARLT